MDLLRAEGTSGEGARKPVAGDGGVAGGACESEDAAAGRRRLGERGLRLRGLASCKGVRYSVEPNKNTLFCQISREEGPAHSSALTIISHIQD